MSTENLPKKENPNPQQKGTPQEMDSKMMAKLIEESNKFKEISSDSVNQINKLLNDVKSGSMVALRRLGDCYRWGNGFEKNAKLAADWYLAAAQRGDLVAQKNLAWCYENGFGVTKDLNEAFRWCKSAAEAGFSKSRMVLADYYEKDLGMEKNQVSKWINQGHGIAMYDLGMCYMEGIGTNKDFKEAMKWIQTSAKSGNEHAQVLMDIYHGEKFAIKEDHKKIVKRFLQASAKQEDALPVSQSSKHDKIKYEKPKIKLISKYLDLASQGDIKAQRQLGLYYLQANRNLEGAIKWLTSAAEKKDVKAQRYLGICYEQGTGVAIDHKKAAKWYERSAKRGDEVAQYQLGCCYEQGSGVDHDRRAAYRWFQASAKQGYALAQAKIDEYMIREIKENPPIKRYLKSAAQGDPEAQRHLGFCYAEGWGVNKNPKEAMRWLKKAAENQDVTAQIYIATCYEEGLGTDKDITGAIKWYREAAKNGNSLAQQSLNYWHQKDEKNVLGIMEPPRSTSPTHSSASLFQPPRSVPVGTPSLPNPSPNPSNLIFTLTTGTQQLQALMQSHQCGALLLSHTQEAHTLRLLLHDPQQGTTPYNVSYLNGGNWVIWNGKTSSDYPPLDKRSDFCNEQAQIKLLDFITKQLPTLAKQCQLSTPPTLLLPDAETAVDLYRI